MESVGESCMGQTAVQLAWVWQRVRTSSARSASLRSACAPSRVAADSAPAFGDRRGYQMDPGNGDEAVRETRLDVEEGADIVMVKPALPYLDLIHRIKAETHMPHPMHSMAPSTARRSRERPLTAANPSSSSAGRRGTNTALLSSIFRLIGSMSTTRSRMRGK